MIISFLQLFRAEALVQGQIKVEIIGWKVKKLWVLFQAAEEICAIAQ